MTNQHPSSPAARRRLLKGAFGLLFLPSWKAWAAPTQINVLTSYPDEVMSRFERAFEKKHPEYRIRFLWRMPHDALPYLQQQRGDETVDVYWSASPRTFARLKADGLLQPLKLNRSGLPARIGNTQISDPDGYFVATEVAGYVFAMNEAKLKQLGVPVPGDWPDLLDPRLQDNIALPVPSEVGFAPVMFDIVLQAYGWEKGWALWSEIAGLSKLVRRGSTFVTDTIGSGDVAIGLSIDFFVKAAIANGAPVDLRYPAHNGVNPGHIALPRAGKNAKGAQAFAAFVLSDEGQRILTERDIRKLPVRPSVYATADAGSFDPFAAAAAGTMNYDGERGRWRLAVISAIFDQMLAIPHAHVRDLWQRVHRAEADGRDTREVRRLLCTPPIAEVTAESPAVRNLFRNELEGGELPRLEIGRKWEMQCAFQRAQARTLLDRMKA